MSNILLANCLITGKALEYCLDGSQCIDHMTESDPCQYIITKTTINSYVVIYLQQKIMKFIVQ